MFVHETLSDGAPPIGQTSAGSLSGLCWREMRKRRASSGRRVGDEPLAVVGSAFIP